MVIFLTSRRGTPFRVTSRVAGVTRMKHPLSPALPSEPCSQGSMSWHRQASAFLPDKCRGVEGGRSIPCRSATFSSHWIIGSSKCVELHSTVCSWAPQPIQRKPVLPKSCLQQPLSSISCILTAHPSSAGAAFSPLQSFCSNAWRLSAAKIFRAQQPGYPQIGLPIFLRCGAFACPRKPARVSWPSSLCGRYFISYVWYEICKALYYTKIRKHNFVLLRLGNKNTPILNKALCSYFLINPQRKSIYF